MKQLRDSEYTAEESNPYCLVIRLNQNCQRIGK